ncbi:cytochrome d ubiquinol oxidase subunit II [uncultured Cellulomonas sp.]|uniref:cytochrome d ubiquinol oxidase subunit II n=1 Tax=uncultured Cellulomonas sp. TaxID=189682 RepID=UPI00262918BC|nr:cytochrome d ubiquinol oxidase subunit II [uncultured Cellulomonas sp.]
MTPFFLGAVAGAIASGRVPAEGNGDLVSSWLNPTSVVGGVIAVGACAFLAGTFLCADATRARRPTLADRIRARTIGVGLASGTVVLGALFILPSDAPTLAQGLRTQGAPLVVASALAGATALALLARRTFAVARVAGVVAVAAVVSGWGVGQHPWMLVDEVTIAQAAGATATLQALLVTVTLAGVLVIPALAYLYRLTQSEPWSQLDH